MINSCCSFRCVNDTRSRASLATASVFAIATLVTLVALTYLRQLPPHMYFTAGGSFAGSILIGTLVATLRCQKPHAPIKNEIPPSIGEQIASPPPQVKPIPPLNEALEKAASITINPHAGKCHPPSNISPFITTEFELTVTTAQEKFTYSVPILQFYDDDGVVFAECIHNSKIIQIPIHEEVGREYGGTGWTWTMPTEKQLPRVQALNGKIVLNDYISLSFAWYRLYHYLPDQAAWYFLRHSSRDKSEFEVPGLKSVKYEDSVLTIERDNSLPLIDSDQVQLLKDSTVEWHRTVGKQLDSPIWLYKAENLEVTVDGEHVTARKNKAESTSFN